MTAPGDDPTRRHSGTVAAMSSQEKGGATGRAGESVPAWLIIVAVVVLVVGLASLVVSVVAYAQKASAQEIAQERDAVSAAARTVVEKAFSFDHRDVDDSLAMLAESSTGDFLVEQEQWAEDVRTRVLEQKAVTTATVSNIAVETLDVDAGDAAVLVVFTAHSEREGEEDITGRQAMRVDLTREDDRWKADAVNQVGVTVPVGQSSESVQDIGLPGEGEAGEGEAGESGRSDKADETDKSDKSDETDAEESDKTPAPTTSAGR